MAIEWRDPPTVPGLRWWECSYQRDGDRYAISIPAKDREEALTLLHEQFGCGQVDGELMAIGRPVDAKKTND